MSLHATAAGGVRGETVRRRRLSEGRAVTQLVLFRGLLRAVPRSFSACRIT